MNIKKEFLNDKKNDLGILSSRPSLLKFFDWNSTTEKEKKETLLRPKINSSPDLKLKVTEIINEVKKNGDQAIKNYNLKFDLANTELLKVSEEEILLGYKSTNSELIESLKVAIRNLKKFHESQKTNALVTQTMPGVVCEKKMLPIEKVGLYIPGGTASLPSTVMMLAIPAIIAGCEEIILVTPPQKNDSIDSSILCVAHLLNIKKIFKVGGAQAIAALAYGTETISKVDKIFGPGNAWVTEAKMQVAYDPLGAAIDLPAGPSEVLVVADKSADAEFVASDLLSQAEHDTSSQVILVSTSKELIAEVELELIKQLAALPRKDIALQALATSRAILVSDIKNAMLVSNQYAPEHLILHIDNLNEGKSMVKNAGSVFLGPWSPESVGDYASGTNHVLPTYGFARAFSGVSVDSFMKAISFQELSVEGLKELGPHVERLACAEGLFGHKNAVSLRLKKIQEDTL